MDTRGASALVDDPYGGLERLATKAGVGFEHLEAAARYTSQEFNEKSAALTESDLPGDMSIVLFGSWARNELTEGSDDDWALLVARDVAPGDAEIGREEQIALRYLGGDKKEPGKQGVFGVSFSVHGLVENVGLDEDTNRNLTRRILLLLESRELAGRIHGECRAKGLDRYLNFGIKNNRPPRFLLNDLVRYWRTICVDFEGKHRETGGEDPKWVTRNAKLRTSRKLLFAGGLLPILLCHLLPQEAMPSFLMRWFTAPPSDRLATAFLHYDAIDEGVRTFAAYDRWIAIMQNGDDREALRGLRSDTREDSPLWQDIRVIGEELQRGLNALLFETDLRVLAPQYVIF